MSLNKSIHDIKKPITTFFMLLSSIEEEPNESQNEFFDYLEKMIINNKDILINLTQKSPKIIKLVYVINKAYSFIKLEMKELSKNTYNYDYLLKKQHLENYLTEIDNMTKKLLIKN